MRLVEPVQLETNHSAFLVGLMGLLHLGSSRMGLVLMIVEQGSLQMEETHVKNVD